MADAGDSFDTLTTEQRAIYEKFRSEIEDLIQPSFDEYFVWKWIKATNYNIEMAKDRFIEHLKFRKRYGLDSLLQDYTLPEVIKNHYSYKVIGTAKEGNLVTLTLTSFCDFRGIGRSLTYFHLVKSFCYVMEEFQQNLKDENRKTGRNARKLISIVDMKGQRYKQLLDKTVRKIFIETALIMETHYPEFLERMYIINVPFFFAAWYNVLKKFLDPIIVNKFQIYGSGGWMESLDKIIDPDIIPAFIGGNRTDPDGNPDCVTLLQRNSEIPVSMYLSNTCGLLKKDPLAKEVTIKERVYYNHSEYVRQKNSILTWSFETVGYDIGFAVYYVPAGVKPMPTTSTPKVSKSFRHRVRRNSKDGHVVLVPLERMECQHYPEVGEVICKEPGTYLLYFDNTYSWIRPKTLYYKAQVLPPSSEPFDESPNEDLQFLEEEKLKVVEL